MQEVLRARWQYGIRVLACIGLVACWMTAGALPVVNAASPDAVGYASDTNTFQLQYPATWSVAMQGKSTVTFSPENTSTRIAGFLIETVADTDLSPADDLRQALSGNNPTVTALSSVQEITVDNALGVSVAVTIPSPTRETQGIAYVGRLLVVHGNQATPPGMRGTNYRIGIFAREGDTATLAQPEQVFASLRFI